MEILYVILAALAPVAVLLFYIFYKDKNQPEPAKWLLLAFLCGIISAPLSLCFSQPTKWFFGFGDGNSFSSIPAAFIYAFSMAAIPEEIAKFIMLWLLLRKNPYFDEQFDGIVYAVCVGMGFAGIENVIYLFDGLESGSWVSIGIARALFAVPGHFIDAVLMGYYLSLFHFRVRRNLWTAIMVLLAPILAHGIYDGILFSLQVNENLAIILVIVFLVFFIRLAKRGKKKIKALVNK